jgi:hypothetical protein
VNVYELLEGLTRKAGFAEPVERDALELIEHLRVTAALGTLAGRTEVTDHEPQYPPRSSVCSVCHKEH